MKKQKKQTIIVIILLAIMVGLYFIIGNLPEKEVEVTSVLEPINTITNNSVTMISFTGSEEQLTFTRASAEDVWVLEGYEDRTVTASNVEDALNACCRITTDTKLTVDNYSDFGFDNPVNVVTLVADGETHTLIYGSYNSVSGVYYVMMDDDPGVYVYSHSESIALDNTAEYFLDDLETEEDAEATDGTADSTITDGTTDSTVTEDTAAEDTSTEDVTTEGTATEGATE